jgi:hypothetical protein
MTPSKLAVSWGLFFSCFVGLILLIDTWMRELWPLDGYEDNELKIVQNLQALAILATALATNTCLMLLAHIYQQRPQKAVLVVFLKLIALWLLFFIPYIAFALAIGIPFYITWHWAVSIHHYGYFEKQTWDFIYEFMAAFLPLLANMLFIYLLFTLIHRLRAVRQKRVTELSP